MRPHTPILVCCASRDRPESLHEAVETFCNTSNMADMAVYVDADQVNMYLDKYDWQKDFGDRLSFTVDKQVGPNASLNTLQKKYFQDYQIFGVIPDDSRFQVIDWDHYVIEEMDKFPGRIGVVTPSHNDGAYCAYPYVSKEWVESVGWYAMPEAHSFIWDTCIELLGEATNITYAPEHLFRMFHQCRQSENFETYMKMDEHAFLSWVVVARAAIVKKLRGKIQSALHDPRSKWFKPC